MENLWNILDGLAIARWEAIFFALLIAAYTVMGLYKSIFVITFGFTFYWGFKNLAFIAENISEGTLVIYVLSGFAVLGLLSLNYLLKEHA